MESNECRVRLKALGCVVVLPTYNNARTLMSVVNDVRQYSDDIMVVNDGSTDATHDLLMEESDLIVVEYPDGKNRGKGYALKTALREAFKRGFRYALTLDSDGQHFASDIPTFVEYAEKNPDTLIVGARNLTADGMPGKNTFANKFSNFWFRVETLQKLVDTQSGFRLYPLKEVGTMRFFTPRYEFEVEVIVRCAWRGMEVVNVPIHVVYPEDRVSHFRPLQDFTRISILNTILVLIALVYYYPKRFIKWLRPRNVWNFLDTHLFHSKESNAVLAASVGLGVCMGIVPIWGFQMAAGFALACVFGLNKILVLTFSNISVPPAIPFIVVASLWVGGLFTGQPVLISPSEVTLESGLQSVGSYVLGACVLGLVAGAVAFAVTYAILLIFRRKSSR